MMPGNQPSIWPMFLLHTCSIAVALYAALHLYVRYPAKRWRFILLVVWLFLAMGAACANLILPTLDLDVLRHYQVTHWIDMTVAVIGYLSIAATFWCISGYYKERGYGI